MSFSRYEANGATSSGCQIQCERLRARHFLAPNDDMLRLRGGVAGIGVDFSGVRVASKKTQRHIEGSRRPVRHAAEVPVVTVAARYSDELTRPAVQYMRRVP